MGHKIENQGETFHNNDAVGWVDVFSVMYRDMIDSMLHFKQRAIVYAFVIMPNQYIVLAS